MADKKDSKPATTSVQVAVRIRPPTAQDASIPSRFQRIAVLPSSSTNVIVDPSSASHRDSTSTIGSTTSGAPTSAGAAPAGKQTFAFDRVLGPQTSQIDMYNVVAEPLVGRFLEGFNCTILAYGQTSSGKTYSMSGPELPSYGSTLPASSGIIPRALHSIFSNLPPPTPTSNPNVNVPAFVAKVAYVELYNEDLIDLLVEGEEGRRDVLIREDKDGRIKWEGLREIGVRSVGEVMDLLRQGSLLRRTNETDMNAQSSRSHAIFSLTLTQRRPLHPSTTSSSTAGSRAISPPPSSYGSARSPSGRTSPAPASRLARPTSSLRSPSPAFGRPSSVVGQVGTRMSMGGLRPGTVTPGRVSPLPGSRASLAGPVADEDEDRGEWVTVTSKFHFVDLAGSERLKRTAAQGERIKEGISINSGLLALGNVISALASLPVAASASAHPATHIPYRDSKLTRLLQDSLGGNAHTLMLACVSPAEYNLSETLNTLKYAARARGIKNVARVSVEEVGWEDIEWLQAQVSKLRKEIAALKALPGSSSSSVPAAAASPGGSTSATAAELGAQLSLLQATHQMLARQSKQEKAEVERLTELLRQGGEESEKRKYAEIVAPVVEEYERRMSGMEVELKLARVALDHTNDMYEEKEAELEEETRRRARSEEVLEELKARVAKLAEREGDTERYVQDLEHKLRTLEESSTSNTALIADLRAQLAKAHEDESSTAAYIQSLEARLARTDENVVQLRGEVERLEAVAQHREDEVARLERRLEVLSAAADDDEREREMRRLVDELEEREERLRELQARVEEAEREKEREQEKEDAEKEEAAHEIPSPAGQNVAQVQLAALRAEHSSSLSDLAAMKSKYENALSEIDSLADQLSKAQLHASPIAAGTAPHSPPPDLPTPEPSDGSEGERNSLLLARPRGRRDGAPPFFRSAASSDQLRARSLSQSQSLSSLSLAQELATPTTRPLALYSSTPPAPSMLLTNGARALSPPPMASLSIMTSLSTGREQVRSPPSPRYSATTLSPPSPRLSLPPPGNARGWASPPSPRFSMGSFPGGREERTVGSLEKEVMRLQEVLNEREAEISALEIALKNSSAPLPALPEDTVEETEEVRVEVPDQSVTTVDNVDDADDTATKRKDEDEDAAFRLKELMRSMAQKESENREVLDTLNSKLAKTTKQYEELTALSRDQAHNMATEMEGLREKLRVTEEKYDSVSAESQEQALTLTTELEGFRSKLRSAEDKQADLTSSLSDLRRRESDLLATLQAEEESHAQAMSKLRAEYDDTLKRKGEDSDAQLSRMKEEHAEQMKRIDMAREGSLTESQTMHAEAMEQLIQENAAAGDRREAAWKDDLERLKAEHARSITGREEESAATVNKLKTDHAAALTRLQEEKEAEAERLKAALAKSREEHEASTIKLREEIDSIVTKMKDQHAYALSELQASHEKAVARARDEKAAEVEQILNVKYEEGLASLKKEHGEAIAYLREEHTVNIQAQIQEHEKATLALKADHQAAMQEAQAAIVQAQQTGQSALDRSRSENESFISEERSRHKRALEELRQMQVQELETLRKAHDIVAEEVRQQAVAIAEAEIERQQQADNHEEELQAKQSVLTRLYQELSNLRTDRDTIKSRSDTLEAEVKRTQEEQAKLLKEASKRTSLIQELEHHRVALAELQDDLQKTKDEKDMLQAEMSKRESVVQQLHDQLALATPKASQSEYVPNGANGHSVHLTLPPARLNSLQGRLPPPSPPPTMPPPPLPADQVPFGIDGKQASTSNAPRASFASDDYSETPTSERNSMAASVKGTLATDGSATAAQLEELSIAYQEQEVMIKTLNKQLAHCENDLQAHMDLVATLETSLNDSERNLRKSRMQATELAKERDALTSQAEALRTQLRDAQQDAATLRRSIAEEKQAMDRRLEEERKAKERARQQLDLRMEEMQKRKSKFVCM